MRIYDPRIGKFLSVDPLTPKYPELTPYQFASNRPIDAMDLDGAEAGHWDPIRGQWMMPSDAIRHPLPPGAYMPSNEAAAGGSGNTTRGAIVSIGVVLTVVTAPYIAAGAVSGLARLGWWTLAHPQSATGVAMTILSAIGGYDGPDVSGVGDDFATMGRKGYEKLTAKGITSEAELGGIARNFYNAIIVTIDEEIKGLSTLELKAKKAFDIRNKAKDFARELSGPELKKKAEAMSAGNYGDAKPSFELLFNKNKEKMLKENPNLSGEDLLNKVYQGIIDGSNRTNEAVNKTHGSN
jgi:hypothetical protein